MNSTQKFPGDSSRPLKLTYSGLCFLVSFLILFAFIASTTFAQSDRSKGIVVTEIVSYLPVSFGHIPAYMSDSGEPTKPALITRVHQGDTDWVEVFNPWEETVVLTNLSVASKPLWERMKIEKIRLSPGEYVYFCETADCKNLGQKTRIRHNSYINFKSHDGVAIYSRPSRRTNTTKTSWAIPTKDVVSWGNIDDTDFLEGTSVRSFHDGTLTRQTGRRGCPKETKNHRKDFRIVSHESTVSDYRHCPGIGPRDKNEYIEIYNASERVIDPVKEGYRLSDNMDAHGNNVNEWYEIVSHPDYSIPNPYMSSTALKPGQIGLIVRPIADTIALSRYSLGLSSYKLNRRSYAPGSLFERLRNGKVKLYTTESTDGKLEFLTDGLNNQTMEYLTFKRLGQLPNQIQIPRKGQSWETHQVNKYQSRKKIDPTGSNTRENWRIVPTGTPGRVE